MIIAKQLLKDYIKNQESMESFADKIELTRQTLYNILNDGGVSSEAIAKFINETGFDFEKAFEVKE